MELLKQKKLGELTDFISRGISPKYVDDDGYIVLNQRCIRENKIDFSNSRKFNKYQKVTKNKFVQIGDTLINSTGVGTLGRTALVRELPNVPVTVDGHITIVRPKKEISPEYLGLFLNCNEPYIENLAGGATGQTELSKADVTRIPVFVPKSTTQKKIAAILTAYDDLIGINNRRIQILEQMAEEIYREWFVRMRFPGYEKTNFIKGIPNGWTIKKLVSVIDFFYGYPFDSSQFTELEEEDTYPIIRIRDILDNRTDTFSKEKPKKNCKIIDGDIIVGMDGDFHIGIWYGGESFLNQRNVCFREKNNISKLFLYHIIQNPIKFLNSIIVGTTVAHLSDRDIKKIRILMPNDELLKKFKEYSDPIFEKVKNLRQENLILEKSRNLLLPRLISSKLSVENLDIKFPPSMEKVNA